MDFLGALMWAKINPLNKPKGPLVRGMSDWVFSTNGLSTLRFLREKILYTEHWSLDIGLDLTSIRSQQRITNQQFGLITGTVKRTRNRTKVSDRWRDPSVMVNISFFKQHLAYNLNLKVWLWSVQAYIASICNHIPFPDLQQNKLEMWTNLFIPSKTRNKLEMKT